MTKRQKRRRPAVTVEGREAQLVSLAYDEAERQLLEGTASSQVITHFLKLGSTRESLEQARLERENLLLDAKVETMASQARVEELYREALDSMRSYAGGEPVDFEDDYYDDPEELY